MMSNWCQTLSCVRTRFDAKNNRIKLLRGSRQYADNSFVSACYSVTFSLSATFFQVITNVISFVGSIVRGACAPFD